MLVTGGARRMGAAISRRLGSDGWRVIIHCHQSSGDAEALAAEIGLGALVIEQDLAAPDAGEALMAAARAAAGGPIAGLVNNASLFEHDFPPIANGNLMQRHMAVNLTAPVMLASAMARQDDVAGGAIVNLLDQKIANLNPDFFSYTCSKLALAGTTRMLAQAFAPCIRVNAVSPGLTLPSLDQSEAEFAAVAGLNLLGRPNRAEAVADAVAYLLRCPGINGETLFVDSGQHFLPRDRDVMFSTRTQAHG